MMYFKRLGFLVTLSVFLISIACNKANKPQSAKPDEGGFETSGSGLPIPYLPEGPIEIDCDVKFSEQEGQDYFAQYHRLFSFSRKDFSNMNRIDLTLTREGWTLIPSENSDAAKVSASPKYSEGHYFSLYFYKQNDETEAVISSGIFAKSNAKDASATGQGMGRYSPNSEVNVVASLSTGLTTKNPLTLTLEVKCIYK